MKKRNFDKFLAIVMAVCMIGLILVPISLVITSSAAGNSDPAYELDFSKCTSADSNVRFYAAAKKTGTLTVSFDYYVPGAAKTYLKNTSTKETYGELGNGVASSFTKSVTYDNNENIALVINQDASVSGVAPGKVYIWNLSVQLNGEEQSLSFKGQYSATNKTITVGDLPAAPKALDKQDRNTKVVKLSGTNYGAFYANRYMDISSGSHTYGISFDYYLASGSASVRDLENAVDVADELTKSAGLKEGVHTFTATYTKDAYSVRLGIQQTSAAQLELYVANFVVTRDGADVTRANDFIKFNLNGETVTVGDISFPGTVYALAGTATADQATAIVLYEQGNALTEGEGIDISFKYLVAGKEDKASFINNPGDSAVKLADLDTDAVLTYHKTLTKEQLGDTVKLAVQLEAGAEAGIYVWDLKIKDKNGTWLEYPTVQQAVENAASDKVSAVDYDSIPIPAPIYHITVNEPYTSVSDKYVGTAKGNYRITFEYFMANDNAVAVGESIDWTEVKDGTTGRSMLLPGHHFFDGSVEITKDRNIAFAVMTRDNLETDLYIKDFRVYYEGKRMETGNMQIYHPTESDAYEYQHYETPGTAPHFPEEEKPDPGEGGDDEPTVIPQEKQLMVLQEHGKEREGKIMEYSQFYQWVGLAYSGNEVKPEQHYKLSFDYYCEPEDAENGIAPKLLAVIRWPSDAKHQDKTAFSAEGNMLKDENGDYYDPLLNPKAGKHKFSQDFTIPGECERFVFGIQTGDIDAAGKVYYWNFSLINTDTGEELLTKNIFENDGSDNFAENAWARYTSGQGALGGVNGRWGVSGDSVDGKGAYSFVPFDVEKAKSTGSDDPGTGTGGGEISEDPTDYTDDEDEGEDIDLSQESADFGDGDIDFGDDDEGEYIYIPGDNEGQTVTGDGVDVVTITRNRTRKRLTVCENGMDPVLLVVSIVEGVLLLGCIVTGVILLISRKKKRI